MLFQEAFVTMFWVEVAFECTNLLRSYLDRLDLRQILLLVLI